MIGRLRDGLKKTRQALSSRLRGLFESSGPATAEEIEALEEALIAADVGVETTRQLLDQLPVEARKSGAALRDVLRERIGRLWPPPPAPEGPPPKPWVSLVVGVNGVGKTTTIGKLAAKRTAEGQTGLLAAADTFRAAACDQLEIWARRAGVTLVRQQEGADPAAVAYDAVQAAVARKLDFAIIDTAGRLHVKHNLMEELSKIYRVAGKALLGAPHQVTLVLDATTGQNGLSQAQKFVSFVPVSDVILTKLDGSAKGGIALSVASTLKVPIRYAGVGEGVSDLIPFDPDDYAQGLLGE